MAFPGGRGAADMVHRCLDAGIPVLGPGRYIHTADSKNGFCNAKLTLSGVLYIRKN